MDRTSPPKRYQRLISAPAVLRLPHQATAGMRPKPAQQAMVSTPGTPTYGTPSPSWRLSMGPAANWAASDGHIASKRYVHYDAFYEVLAHWSAALGDPRGELAADLVPITLRPEGLKTYFFVDDAAQMWGCSHDAMELHRPSPTHHAQLRTALLLTLGQKRPPWPSFAPELNEALQQVAKGMLRGTHLGEEGGLRLHCRDGTYLLELGGSHPALPTRPAHCRELALFYAAVLRQAWPPAGEVQALITDFASAASLRRFAQQVTALI